MIALILLALALAMDALAVSLVRGTAGPKGWRPALETGVAFGVAQGLMPLLGWSLGLLFAEDFAAFDHWIACGLLTFLGLRMIREALDQKGEDEEMRQSRSYYLGLLLSALATSVDAAAAGVTLELFAAPVAVSCGIIGAITAVLCVFGHRCGGAISDRAGTRAELIGGVVLIGLGVKILLEHTVLA
jgi:putative Mn2+ efflux pump MntP